MGGVDKCDQNISNYSIFMRSKKWWWGLFAWIPDMVVQNCWIFYRENKKAEDPTLDLLAFRRKIVQKYLKQYIHSRSQSGRPCGRILPASRRVSIDVRTDRVDHYQSHLSTSPQMRYLQEEYKKRVQKVWLWAPRPLF